MKRIVVEKLKYRYPTSKDLILNNLSFTIDSGEMIGIIGRNTSGKSTLCQAFVGLVPHFYQGAYGGKVWVDGMEVRESSIADLSMKVGIVFQNPFTQITGAKLTVYEEIAFGLENIGLARKEMIHRIDEVMDLFGIEPYKDRNPFDLSGGQMQRVAIASMVVMKPKVMVLDEPTSQLDPQGSEEVFQAIQKLSQQGITVILVEHKMEKIAQYCQKVLLLDQGSLVAFDKPDVVFSRDDLETYGMAAPVYTQVCKALDQRMGQTDLYPVSLDDACHVLRRNQ